MDLGLGHLGPRTGTFAGGPGSGLGQNRAPEPGKTPTGPRVARTTGPKAAFSRFCLNRIFEFWKKKKSQHLGAFFPGTIFFTFFAGSRWSSGTQNQRQNSKFQNPLSRPEKYPHPHAPPPGWTFSDPAELALLFVSRPTGRSWSITAPVSSSSFVILPPSPHENSSSVLPSILLPPLILHPPCPCPKQGRTPHGSTGSISPSSARWACVCLGAHARVGAGVSACPRVRVGGCLQ